jgi:DNA primase
MPKRYSANLLGALRNEIPITHLITEILDVPSKISEGYFRFLCPLCREFNTATNPKTNLARCFRCAKNFNPIDFVMATRHWNFVDAVQFLVELRIVPSTTEDTSHGHELSQHQLPRRAPAPGRRCHPHGGTPDNLPEPYGELPESR